MRPGAPLLASLLLTLAIGCGGSKKVAAPAGGDGEAASADCDPGRCLEDISALVDENRPAARACYEEGHRRDPTLSGRIMIKFEIDPSGAVVDASQGSQDEQIEDEQVVECVADVIRRITFAPSKRGKSTKAFHRYEFNPPRN